MPKASLTAPENDLRRSINSTYREWKKKYSQADSKGYWGSRVTFSFKWPQTRQQMESLAERNRIDLSKIGFDFELLKKARDSVAHSGKIPEEMSSGRDDTYKLLTAAQYGLQLVLLVELGYSDLVINVNKGWKSYVEINKVLRDSM